MQSIVPGHVRGYTWVLALFVCGTAGIVTGRSLPVLGLAILVLGAFLGDQATHLAQMDHSALPPTWLERQMQDHRTFFQVFGLCLAVLGVRVAF